MMLAHKMKVMLKMMVGGYGCGHTDRLLFDFVEGGLDDRRRLKLEEHLADCPECLEFVETYRQTIALAHDHAKTVELEVPPRLIEKLDEFIDCHPDLK
jgi:hypothetical protein